MRCGLVGGGVSLGVGFVVSKDIFELVLSASSLKIKK